MMRFRAFAAALLAGAPLVGWSQVQPDASLATSVSRSGRHITIGGGTRVGGNLFHGFSQFDLLSREVATFTAAGTVERIVARVTSAAPSYVGGRLVSPVSLYLINPNGWVFGPDASLDVRGAFTVSSADYLSLGSNGRFDATQPERSVLSAAAPSAFGFLRAAPAAIIVEDSRLAARPGERLSFAGGDLRFSGARLTAPGGSIELEAHAALDAARSLFAADTAGTGLASGSISIRAGRLVLSDATSVQSVNDAAGAGGAILVQSSGDAVLDNSAISTRTSGGAGGALSVHAANVSLLNGAQIDTASLGPGRGGALSIAAAGTVGIGGRNASGIPSGVLSFALAGGDAGSIDIRGGALVIDGAAISARTYAAGNAGTVDIAVERVALANAAQIDATTLGPGRGGDLNVTASREVVISGQAPARSGLFASAEFAAGFTVGAPRGDAGTIRVRTPLLVLADGGFISSGTFAPATGAGGSVLIDAGRIVLESGGEIGSRSTGAGLAGSLSIAARSIELRGGLISTETVSANGGDIAVAARDLVYLKDAAITTSVAGGRGDGGNITIDPQFVVLDNSQVIANAFEGRGGNITIVASNFLSQSSVVQASSQLGISGNVVIQSPRIDVSGALRVLSTDYLDASRLIRSSCASRADRASSSFIAGQRGGLAPSPESGQQLAERGAVGFGCVPLERVPPVLDAPPTRDHHVAH